MKPALPTLFAIPVCGQGNERTDGGAVNILDIEAATFFQQILVQPVGSRDRGGDGGNTPDSQGMTTKASRSSSFGVHGTTRG